MLAPERVLREKAVFASFIYDVVPLPIAFVVAIMSGSLTMLGEVLRGVFLVSMAFLSWITLRRIHRGRDGGYDFGLGKLEQVLSLLVALALCASIAFIWYKAFTRTAAIPHDIDAWSYLAVGMTLINLFANSAPLPLLYKAKKTGHSVLVLTQFRAKVAKSIGSAIATVCVAINQLVSDPSVSLWADRAGIAVVTIITLHAAYELMKSAIPDLLDRTLPEDMQVKINQVLARHYDDFDALKWCRSRQSGSEIEVHVGLGFAPNMTFERVAEIAASVRQDIEATVPGSRAVVTPVLLD
jgi:cation diffusion facilitator family transporter